MDENTKVREEDDSLRVIDALMIFREHIRTRAQSQKRELAALSRAS